MTTTINGQEAILSIKNAGYGQYIFKVIMAGETYTAYSTNSSIVDAIKSDINSYEEEEAVNAAIEWACNYAIEMYGQNCDL